MKEVVFLLLQIKLRLKRRLPTKTKPPLIPAIIIISLEFHYSPIGIEHQCPNWFSKPLTPVPLPPLDQIPFGCLLYLLCWRAVEMMSIETLDDLCEQLHRVFSSDHVNVEEVHSLMSSYKSNPAHWSKYAKFDRHRYTRNLVNSGNGKFNLMILCWNEGQGSCIHDHADAHCFMKILQGELHEVRFDWPSSSEADEELRQLGTTPLHLNDVAYINDSLGLHRVENPNHTETAVSLHLYCPPYQRCHMFDQRTGHKSEYTVTFWSKYGERIIPEISKLTNWRPTMIELLLDLHEEASAKMAKNKLVKGKKWQYVCDELNKKLVGEDILIEVTPKQCKDKFARIKREREASKKVPKEVAPGSSTSMRNSHEEPVAGPSGYIPPTNTTVNIGPMDELKGIFEEIKTILVKGFANIDEHLTNVEAMLKNPRPGGIPSPALPSSPRFDMSTLVRPDDSPLGGTPQTGSPLRIPLNAELKQGLEQQRNKMPEDEN